MRIFRAALVLATALLALPASAQESWPERPIRLLVPTAAGGGIDLMARILAEGLTQQLRQRVFVENQSGAGGLIAERAVASGQGDGYTFLFPGPGHAALPYIHKNPGYDVKADFASVSLVARYPLVMVINPALPAKTLGEFIAMVKASPGKYTYGSSGIGGASHIPLAAFAYRAGLDMVHVPFRGSGETTAALLGGQIDLVIDGLAPQLAQIRGGRVRPLAVSTKDRSQFMSEIPTIGESLPGFQYPMWVAVFAASKTPKPIIDKMSAAIALAVKDPMVQKRFAELLVDPVGSTPQELDRFLNEQLTFNKDIIEQTNIRVSD